MNRATANSKDSASLNPHFLFAPEAVDLILRAGEYVAAKKAEEEADRQSSNRQGASHD